MYEKISDEPIRKQKVKKLKNKILKEIDCHIKIYKREMMNIENEYYDNYVKEYFALLQLKEYLGNEYCFMQYEIKDYNEDKVVYMVSDKLLNIWSQKYYYFANHFLSNVEKNKYHIFGLLNDRYFGYEFTNLFDIVLYDKKQEELVGLNE